MQLGFALPGMRSYRGLASDWEATASPDQIAAIVRRADELGFDFLTFPDHIVVPGDYHQVHGRRWLDPLTAIGFAAALSRRIRLMTWVLIVPYRNPLPVAKAVATADVLSNGRVTLGM